MTKPASDAIEWVNEWIRRVARWRATGFDLLITPTIWEPPATLESTTPVEGKPWKLRRKVGAHLFFTLLERRGVEFNPARLGPAEIFLRQHSAEHSAIREQRDPVIAAERRHRGLGLAIDERVQHLVRYDADAVIADSAKRSVSKLESAK